MLNKIYKGLFLFAVVLLIGTLVFFLAFDYSVLDAFFMTVITITTVGFGEVQPLDDGGKLFTIFLLLISIVAYGYLVTVISEFFLKDTLVDAYRTKKNLKKIARMEGHTIICGFGRNGKQAFEKLKKYNKSCVIIEKDEDKLIDLLESNTKVIRGDATNDEVLIDAGIYKASNLIAASSSDANNVYIVLSSRQLNPKINIVSRASSDQSVEKMKIAGADDVIMPDRLGGEHMASLLVTPDLVKFVDMLGLEGEKNANLEEISVEELPKEYILKSIQDLDVRRNSGCNVIGFVTEDDEYIVNPSSNTILRPQCKLIVLGSSDQIKKFIEVYE
ncbi:potassium channel family protein [Wenyingzhuangia sp. IMCC45533]